MTRYLARPGCRKAKRGVVALARVRILHRRPFDSLGIREQAPGTLRGEVPGVFMEPQDSGAPSNSKSIVWAPAFTRRTKSVSSL